MERKIRINLSQMFFWKTSGFIGQQNHQQKFYKIQLVGFQILFEIQQATMQLKELVLLTEKLMTHLRNSQR